MLGLISAAVDLATAFGSLTLNAVDLITVVLLLVVPLCTVLYYVYRLPMTPEFRQFVDILIGHRGCRLELLMRNKAAQQRYPEVAKHAPMAENSLTAIRFALEHGVQGIEIDTHLTKDGVPIVIHDLTLDRLCGVRGNVNKLTLAEMQKIPLLLSATMEPCPTLEEVVKVIQAHGDTRFMIETKEVAGAKEMARQLVGLFQRYPFLYKNAYVASFIPQAVFYVRQLDPKIVTMLLVRKDMFASWANDPYHPAPLAVRMLVPVIDVVYWWSMNSWLPSFLGTGLIGIHNEIASVEMVQNWRKRGYGVNIWVTNTTAERDFFKSLGCSVTTDFVYDPPM